MKSESDNIVPGGGEREIAMEVFGLGLRSWSSFSGLVFGLLFRAWFSGLVFGLGLRVSVFFFGLRS